MNDQITAPQIIGLIILAIIFIIVEVLPFLIAKKRGHKYQWIILVLCILAIPTGGIAWIISLVWAIFPSDTSIFDPLLDPTSKDAATSVGKRVKRFNRASDSTDELLKWKQLLDSGAITKKEFQKKKAQLMED